MLDKLLIKPRIIVRHHGNDAAAVALELAAADAGDLRERRERGGPPARDLDQGRIVKDHVRRQLLTPRLGEAPGAQRFP